MSERTINRVRGRHISIILQDPMSSLNPSFTIGSQIAEALALHQNLRGAEMERRVVDILAKVGIAEPARRRHDFPHQLSGGMRQRVVSAIALSCQPDVLLADEPTTSLDPTIRVQFLKLLKALQAELGFAMIFISHDMATVARVCDRVAVMYAGLIIEHAPIAAFLRAPVHPYSRALIGIMESARIGGPRLDRIEGSPPDPRSLPPGCAFAPRCGFAMDHCRVEAPPEASVGPGHQVRCWLAEQRS
jgi:oligopeptide/dipeptide ABC transporter ATP-binding protein